MKSDLGLGLVQAGGKLSYFNNTDPKAYKDIIRKAIRDGLRSFDSAYTYQNADELLSSVIKEQHIQREDYDITTKIMPLPTFKKKAEVCLKRLNVDFLDTLLIHWQTQDEALLFSTLKTLEALKEEKKCINIGVSNFPFTLLAKISRDFEINVLERAYSLIWTKEIDEAKLLGIKLYCYAPLGEGLLSGKYRRPEDLNDNRKQLWVFRYPLVYNQLLDKVSQIAKNRLANNGKNYRSTELTFDFNKISDKFESADRMFSYIERKYSDEVQTFKKSNKTYVVTIFENLKKDSLQKDSLTVRDVIQSLVTEETSAIASYNVALETLKDHIPAEAYEAIKAIRDDEQRHVENLYAVLNGNVTPKNLEN